MIRKHEKPTIAEVFSYLKEEINKKHKKSGRYLRKPVKINDDVQAQFNPTPLIPLSKIYKTTPAGSNLDIRRIVLEE